MNIFLHIARERIGCFLLGFREEMLGSVKCQKSACFLLIHLPNLSQLISHTHKLVFPYWKAIQYVGNGIAQCFRL